MGIVSPHAPAFFLNHQGVERDLILLTLLPGLTFMSHNLWSVSICVGRVFYYFPIPRVLQIFNWSLTLYLSASHQTTLHPSNIYFSFSSHLEEISINHKLSSLQRTMDTHTPVLSSFSSSDPSFKLKKSSYPFFGQASNTSSKVDYSGIFRIILKFHFWLRCV